jgi:hypothetical protein
MNTNHNTLTPAGQRLILRLKQEPKAELTTERIHVPEIGGNLSFAYEQLRNAAEYREVHLLMRGAIQRFLHREVDWRYEGNKVGLELITELTQARYIENNTVAANIPRKIDEIIREYKNILNNLKAHSTRAEQMRRFMWVEEIASVEIEHLIIDYKNAEAFAEFAYAHLLDRVDRKPFNEADESTYSLGLYVAMHRALLKSDRAVVRYNVMQLYRTHGQDMLSIFETVNKQVDELFNAPITNKLFRLINRHGAPLRAIFETIQSHPHPDKLISQMDTLNGRIRTVSEQQYSATRKRLTTGIIRSIIFIFITKMLIGFAVEVPFDIAVHGAILWFPLAINLMFPPIYMALLGLSLRTPGPANTEAIVNRVDRILYDSDKPIVYTLGKKPRKSMNNLFNFIYLLTFLISFGLLLWLLSTLHFNLASGVIFFVFLSVVSFFGFRLMRMAKEMVIVDENPSFIDIIVDFFLTPFIRAGQWLSDKYSKINLITNFLDIAIEAPLKVLLRVLREWTLFLREKRDEL